MRMKPLLGVSINAIEVKKGDQEQTVEVKEEILNKIITSDLNNNEPDNSPFESVDSDSLFSRELDSSQNANNVQQSDNITVEKDRG